MNIIIVQRDAKIFLYGQGADKNCMKR